jgi:PAS domain S-box-containing protein
MEFLRQHNEVLFHKLDKKIRDLDASQQLVSNLLDNSPSLIYIVDREGRFLHLNRPLEISMRHSREEIVGRTREAFLPADMAAAFRANDLRVLETGAPLTFEEVGREPDGEHTYFTVKFPLRDEEGRPYAVCGISTDISDKKQLERDLQRITDLHVMLYHLNRALRAATTEPELFEAACQVCAEHGKFDLAWIGRILPDQAQIRPEFQAGTLAAYAAQLQINPGTHDPTATSLREDRIVVCPDWQTDANAADWSAQGEAFGIRSSAALPIHYGDGQAVVFNLYSSQPRFFTADRLVLLEEMARDLAHALDSLHHARRRREAEEALAERELEFRAAFEQGSLGLAQVSLDGRFLKVNRRFCELLQHEAEEIIGQHIQDFTYPADRAASSALFRSVQSGETERYHLQKRALRKDGQPLWIELNGCTVRGPDGKLLYYLSALEDISERKAAEERLQEEKLKLQTLVETIPDLVWLKDTDGVYRFCNPRFEAFFGKRMEEILGKTDYDFVDREQADFFRAHDRLAMERGGPSINDEWVTFASDGHRELLETIKTPMRNVSGETLGVLSIARDVTRSRADQERLRKLSMAIEQNTVAVIIANREGYIEYINPRFTEITGYGAEEVLGQNPRILKSWVTPPEVYHQLWTTILGGQVWRGELQNRRKSGDIYWATLSISPILDESGSITHFVALQEDITGRMRMGEQLQESEEQYHSLFKNMLNGFALCRMIYDDQGRGEDFVYLAVNHAFETLTGLKDVQGKRVSEVIPGIQESNQDLLDLYGRVARTGVPESCETYVKSLDMWFSISVYSPKPDHFVAMFDVITERKRAEAAVKAQLNELQRWHEATLGREDRILDLKREVNALQARLGDPPRYASADFDKAQRKQP